MGTFEKLGILVIVVIIVMILAVAIYQWGGNGAESPLAVDAAGAPRLTVRDLRDYESAADSKSGEADDEEGADGGDDATWPSGIPKTYTVRRNDSLWVVVFRQWRLKDSFVGEIARANPGLDVKRLQPGRELAIPDPAGFHRDRQGATETPAHGDARVYEVQIGDTLESVARTHLGRKNRWHEIVKLNPGLRPERLRPGQKILLPALR